MATVEIRLKRPTKVYHEGETVCGLIEVESKTAIAHQSISLVAEGIAALTLSAKSVGRLESMYNNMKPVPLFNYSTELARQGKLAAGKTTVPFEFVLKPRGSIKSLLETYHGVFISVQKTDMQRFSVRGRLDSCVCCITKPFMGELIVERSENPIRSIELQLMRVETVGSAE
uniref:Uncharacterized protein n=1 Tax=Ciona savignyi TaxID=51511 RepID=H2YPC0_CIOSA